jgi:hypothetical protein
MTKKNNDIPKITAANTKKEMLEAYAELTEKLKVQARQELQPEKTKEELRKKEVLTVAGTLTSEKVVEKINILKVEIGNALTDITAKLEEETRRYGTIKEAIAAKEKELNEIFEIEKSAYSLAALLESQKQKKLEFEAEMAKRRETLEEEISLTKATGDREEKAYAEALKEQKQADEKARKREKEEYEYKFSRDKEQKLNALLDEINQLEKELSAKKEEFDQQVKSKEKELKEREAVVADREKITDDLQAKVDGFPKELDNTVNKAVQEITERLTTDAAKNEELLVKGFEGEKNVLSARIKSMEQLVGEQKKHIETLSAQIEKAYGKVQDIAVKAVASAQPRQIMDVSKTSGHEQEK